MESILLKDIIQKPISGEWGLEDLYGTGIPVLRTANFTNEGIINFENVVTRNISPSKLKGKLLQKGDILLEKSGGSDRQPVGRVVYFDGQADKYGFNNFTSALRISDLTMWNPKYIFYALYANYHHGGTRKYENKTTGLHNLKVDLFIRSFSVPYATLIKQNEIVKKLDLLNHLENVCEVQLQKLDELIKSRFLELFGDPLAGNAKWPIHNLCMVADAIDPQPSHRAPPIDKNGIPYISIKDCDYNTGKIDFEKARKVNVKVLQEQKTKYQIHNGDMMIGKIGTIGYPVFLPTYETYTLSANVILIQPNKSKVQPCFLKYSLESPYVESQFDKAKHSTSQSAFGILKIRKIKVMNPELSIQNQFADFVNQVDKSKMAVQKSLDELETLKKSLMQTYFG